MALAVPQFMFSANQPDYTINYYDSGSAKVAFPARFISPLFPDLKSNFLDEYAYPAHFNLTFNNAILTGQFNVISNGRVFNESLKWSTYSSAVASLLCNKVVKGRDDTIYIVGSNPEWRNYSHFLRQALPAILDSLKYVRGQPFKVVMPLVEGYRTEYFKLMGLSDENILLLDRNESLAAKRLVYSSFLFTVPATHPVAVEHGRVVGEAALPARAAYPERLFVSREDAARRPLENSNELFSGLEQLGFSKITLTGLSVADQIHYFRSARIIVSLHGAGLANLIHTRPGSAMVELMPDNCRNPVFFKICQQKRINYWLLPTTTTDPSDKHGSASRADVADVLRVVRDEALPSVFPA